MYETITYRQPTPFGSDQLSRENHDTILGPSDRFLSASRVVHMPRAWQVVIIPWGIFLGGFHAFNIRLF